MNIPFDTLATITISYNEKGQFVFDLTGSDDGAKALARAIVRYAQDALNKTTHTVNKLVLSDYKQEKKSIH